MLDVKIASALNKIIQKLPLQEESQSRGTESPQKRAGFFEEDRSLLMIYDYCRVTGAHDTVLAVLDYADLFSITLRDDNVQEFDARWVEVLLSMSKIPSDDVYKLRIRESEQLKTVLELYDMEIHQKVSMTNSQRLKTMVKRSIDQKLRLRNFDARREKIETGAVVSSGKKKGSVRRETNAVSGMRATIVRNRHRKPNHALSHNLQKREVEACRERIARG